MARAALCGFPLEPTTADLVARGQPTFLPASDLPAAVLAARPCFGPTLLDLLGKTACDDTGWEGKHPDTEESDQTAQQLPDGRDRKNVSIADGRERRDAPP